MPLVDSLNRVPPALGERRTEELKLIPSGPVAVRLAVTLPSEAWETRAGLKLTPGTEGE